MSQCGSVEHQGDNRTGEGEGDDEQVKNHFIKVPAEVKKLVLLSLFTMLKTANKTLVWWSNSFYARL